MEAGGAFQGHPNLPLPNGGPAIFYCCAIGETTYLLESQSGCETFLACKMVLGL